MTVESNQGIATATTKNLAPVIQPLTSRTKTSCRHDFLHALIKLKVIARNSDWSELLLWYWCLDNHLKSALAVSSKRIHNKLIFVFLISE